MTLNEAIKEFYKIQKISYNNIFESNNKNKILTDIEIDRKYPEIQITDLNNTKYENIINIINDINKKDLYDQFVPDEYTEIEGERRDLDDWDEYSVNLQNTISRQNFWDQLYDELCNYVENLDKNNNGLNIKASKLYKLFLDKAEEISTKAFEEYQPNEDTDTLIHKGIDKGRAYWGI